MRTIDADAFTEQYGNYYAEQGPEEGFIGTVGDLIAKQPTIDTVRHGEWHECWHTDTVCSSICTNCGKAATQARVIVGQELMTNVSYPLCSNCGAIMDADEIAERRAAADDYAETDNTCVCCGAPIPEGRQICLICERGADNETGRDQSESEQTSEV